MKTIILFIGAALIVLTSCNPCKRLQRKCPPVIRDSISYVETVHDSIIKIYIPGDTTYIEVDAFTLEDLGLEIENDNQAITAKVEEGVFKLEAICKEDSLIEVIHFLQTAKLQVKYREVEKEVAVKFVPMFYKWCLGILIVLVLITAGYIYLRIKFGGIKKVFS